MPSNVRFNSKISRKSPKDDFLDVFGLPSEAPRVSPSLEKEDEKAVPVSPRQTAVKTPVSPRQTAVKTPVSPRQTTVRSTLTTVRPPQTTVKKTETKLSPLKDKYYKIDDILDNPRIPPVRQPLTTVRQPLTTVRQPLTTVRPPQTTVKKTEKNRIFGKIADKIRGFKFFGRKKSQKSPNRTRKSIRESVMTQKKDTQRKRGHIASWLKSRMR
jgi:hypothetical protein